MIHATPPNEAGLLESTAYFEAATSAPYRASYSHRRELLCVTRQLFSALSALPLSRRRTDAHVSSFIRRLSTRCWYLWIALSSVVVRSCLSLPRMRCSLCGNRSKHHHHDGAISGLCCLSPGSALFSFFVFRFPPARAWTQPVI